MRINQLLNSLLLCSLLASTALMAQTDTPPTFRFHSGLEPATVDPAALIDATGGFLFFNLYRTLYRLDKNNIPQPELAEKCSWQDKYKLILFCRLKPNLKFSNGQPLTASHFVSAWRRLIDPKTGSRHAELLLSLANAQKINRGEAQLEELGVIARNDRLLEIKLEQPDLEFLFKISSPVLTPLWSLPPTQPEKFNTMVGTGPYRISQWHLKTRIQLEPNPYYPIQNNRPLVEILILEEDSTALQMFDLGKLDFLRRLNIKEIPSRKKGPDFHFIPTYRFDYIGFGPDLKDQLQLRKALALSLNYPELTKAYLTPGQVGCPSLPKSLSQPWPCLHFDLKAATQAWSLVPTMFQSSKTPALTLTYSRAGGEDIGRGMEWMQSQWKKHLGLQVSLQPLESGFFFQTLKDKPPTLFRKGTNLDRPTCLAALEIFASNSIDNNIGLHDKNYDDLLAKLRTEGTLALKKKWCGQALRILIDQYRIIPLGELYFAILAKPHFRGWRVTPLNQLDLTQLKFVRN